MQTEFNMNIYRIKISFNDGLEFDTKMKARNKNDAVRKVKADEKIKCFTIIGEGIKSIEVEALKNRRRVT